MDEGGVGLECSVLRKAMQATIFGGRGAVNSKCAPHLINTAGASRVRWPGALNPKGHASTYRNSRPRLSASGCRTLYGFPERQARRRLTQRLPQEMLARSAARLVAMPQALDSRVRGDAQDGSTISAVASTSLSCTPAQPLQIPAGCGVGGSVVPATSVSGPDSAPSCAGSVCSTPQPITPQRAQRIQARVCVVGGVGQEAWSSRVLTAVCMWYLVGDVGQLREWDGVIILQPQHPRPNPPCWRQWQLLS